MFITAIICTFILVNLGVSWVLSTITNWKLKDASDLGILSVISACVTFLTVYYNII